MPLYYSYSTQVIAPILPAEFDKERKRQIIDWACIFVLFVVNFTGSTLIAVA